MFLRQFPKAAALLAIGLISPLTAAADLGSIPPPPPIDPDCVPGGFPNPAPIPPGPIPMPMPPPPGQIPVPMPMPMPPRGPVAVVEIVDDSANCVSEHYINARGVFVNAKGQPDEVPLRTFCAE